MNCRVCKFLLDNGEYKNYINKKIKSNFNLVELNEEIKTFDVSVDFNVDDLEHHKYCIENLELSKQELQHTQYTMENIIENKSVVINIENQVEEFKTKSAVEKTMLFDDLLKETSYKVLSIVNEKLNLYGDKIPKDDIQAFKTLYDLTNKVDVVNCYKKPITTHDDLTFYSNKLINNLMNCEYLTKEECIDLLKLVYDKNTSYQLFK